MGIIGLFLLASLKPANFIDVFKESETGDMLSHGALAEATQGARVHAYLKASEISHTG